MTTSSRVEPAWRQVCVPDDIVREHGVAALIGSTQVAIFRTWDDRFYALDNRDPFTGANVLSRGIVGSRGGAATVASPLHKQVFALATGVCLDDPGISVAVFPVRVRHGSVEVEVL